LEDVKMSEITTYVGRREVRDATMLGADPDRMTLQDGLGFDRRAAHVVLVDAKPEDVGGPEVRFARKALGLTQAELAELLDVYPTTVAHWEGTTGAIQRTTKLAIAELLEQAMRGPAWPPRAWYESREVPSERVLQVRKTGTDG
jgi:DNA-binding XRE family transcriptional regulator